MEPILQVAVMVGMVGMSQGLNYPLFYLTPPSTPPDMEERVAFVATPMEEGAPPLITNRLEVALDPSREGEHYQVSQFHSQDAKGRFFFGFRSPDQVRLETRNSDGTIKGSYSYIDPYGQLIKMQYWDDGSGFHTSGDNLPSTYFNPPEYTPEVQAAREEHFRLYKQALEAALAAGDGKEYEEKVEYPEVEDSSQEKEPEEELDEEEREDEAPHPAVEEGDDEDVIDLENYPKVQYPPGVVTPNHAFDEEEDAVAIENPELSFENAVLTRFWQRRGKNLGGGESKPVYEEVDEGYDHSPNDRPSLTITKSGSETRSAVTRLDKKGPNIDGFYYHFQHYIPVQVLAHDDMAEGASNVERQSVSALVKQTGAVPVAAVHDPQVSPLQREVPPPPLVFLPVTRVFPYPTEAHYSQVSPFQTGIVPGPVVHVPEHVVERHDGQVSPLQKAAQQHPLQDTLAKLLKETGPKPAVEIHDTQVSPLQRSNLPELVSEQPQGSPSDD